MRQAIERNDESMIGALICVLVSFAPKEALEDVAEAYQRDLVDTGLVDFGSVSLRVVVQQRRRYIGGHGVTEMGAESLAVLLHMARAVGCTKGLPAAAAATTGADEPVDLRITGRSTT